VTDGDVGDYLAELEQSGFVLEYLVYESPTDSERAAEKAAAGEWDAVRADKGPYHLQLEFGDGTGTIDISGIPMGGFGPSTS